MNQFFLKLGELAIFPSPNGDPKHLYISKIHIGLLNLDLFAFAWPVSLTVHITAARFHGVLVAEAGGIVITV